MAPVRRKLGEDPKPSTSKSTTNSEENICSKRQTTKVKPRSKQEENSPKANKKSPKKLAKKSIEKSPDDSKPSTSKRTANSEENIIENRQASKKGAMQEENSLGNEPSPHKAVKKSPKKLAKKSIEKPSTSKRTANSEENISPNRQASKKVKPGAIQEENLSGDELSLPKVVKKSPKKLAKKNIEKSPDDSKPSTSKSRANSEENISPNRQASKRVSWCPSMQEENSSGDEPSPPKAVKKSPQKPAKKDLKKSPSYYEKPNKKQKLIEEGQKMENNVEEIEVCDYPPFCCNSIRPRTDQEAIFNQFMENRGSTDRIFEVIRRESNGRKFISIKYFDLHDGIRTKIDPYKPNLMYIIWRSKITILKTDCELHNRSFELNSLQKRMTGPWKIEAEPTVDYNDYSPKQNPATK